MPKNIKGTKETIKEIMKETVMTTEQFFKEVVETSREQDKFLEFYDLADKYGFCTPWCECLECS